MPIVGRRKRARQNGLDDFDRGNRERRKENRHRSRGDVMTGVEDFLTDRAIGGIVARRIFVVIVLVLRGTQRLDGL